MLAWILLICAGVALLVGIGIHDNEIRAVGAVLCVVSASFFKISKNQIPTDLDRTGPETRISATNKRANQLLWIASLESVPLLGTSFHFLYRDAVRGYDQFWPVYLFAGVSVVCASIWGALIAGLFSGRSEK